MIAQQLKSLTVADEIKSDSELMRSVERATNLLIDELGDSSHLVDVTWNYCGKENGSGAVELEVADFTGSASERFSFDELRNEGELQRRLYGLWGKLLRQGMRRLLDRFHEVVQELEG